MRRISQKIFYGDSISFKVALKSEGAPIDASNGVFEGGVVDSRTNTVVAPFEFSLETPSLLSVFLGSDDSKRLAVSSGRYSFYVKYIHGDFSRTFITVPLEIVGNA